jgi:hypothetical protein
MLECFVTITATAPTGSAAAAAIRPASDDPMVGGSGWLALILCIGVPMLLVIVGLILKSQLRSIAINTFFESIRQPIVSVVLVIVTIALILSNPLSAFTMEDDQRMLIDIGMATVFLGGALLAAFVATGVLTREIENRTALTVVSKPVSRPWFVIGKFLGVGGALLLATLYMSFVFLLVEQHTVLQTVRDPVHVPVIVFGVSAAILGIGGAVWCNFFYNKNFTSFAILFTTPLAGLAYLFSLLFRHDFSPRPIASSFDPNMWLGLIALMIAVLVLTAIAIAASARLGQMMTLVITLGLFLLGLLSDWFFGRPIGRMRETWLERAEAAGLTETVEVTRTITLASGEVKQASTPEIVEQATVPLTQMAEGAEIIAYGFYWAFYSILPNFQVLWLTDGLTQGHAIPPGHVAMTAIYGLGYMAVALSVGVILFQRREVG